MKELKITILALLMSATLFGQKTQQLVEVKPPIQVMDIYFYNDIYMVYKTNNGFILTREIRPLTIYRETFKEITELLTEISVVYAIYHADLHLTKERGNIIHYHLWKEDIGKIEGSYGFLPLIVGGKPTKRI